ncbi:hypothetical protein FB567DRAFT_537187 [Paraphoma chrysanthemicola]|uniref:Secreted protein n=1 Tax=Paraphoma chrysanthemicola TaxID=798071 RepID=A0A8K0QVL3_9PLEO|nr:hypothetical protein FB567DRAFT_537187 [Paraphoma chrysanthemicola]
MIACIAILFMLIGIGDAQLRYDVTPHEHLQRCKTSQPQHNTVVLQDFLPSSLSSLNLGRSSFLPTSLRALHPNDQFRPVVGIT